MGTTGRRSTEAVVEGRGEEFEFVLQRDEGAGELESGVVVDVAPEGGVRGIFAFEGVVADELEGELVLVDEHVGGKDEGGLEECVVFVAGDGYLRFAG